MNGVSTTEEESSSDESYNEEQYIRLNKPISSHAYASCPKGNDDIPNGHCTPSGIVIIIIIILKFILFGIWQFKRYVNF